MGSRTRSSPGPDLARGGERGAWWREPLVWLAAVVFVASVAASAWTIVVAARHADEPLPTHGRSVIGVPVAHAPGAAPAGGGEGAGSR
jgi:hypothetical protein